MAVKLPEAIYVGPFVYTVTTDEVDILRERHRQQSGIIGYCDPEALTIGLDTKQCDGSQRDTLLHESLHALTAMTGIVKDLGADEEEKVILRLTPALLDLLRRNPMLVAYLREGA